MTPGPIEIIPGGPAPVAFGDAIDPARIPATISHAALYGADCDYPCPPEQAARFAPADRRWITFTGERKSSIADFEPGTEVYHDVNRLRVWATVRAVRPALGLSLIYSDLSDVWKAQKAVAGAPHMWWLATKDTGWLTAAELSQRLAAEFGVTVHPSQIWGHQRILTSQPGWDESRTFGAWR